MWEALTVAAVADSRHAGMNLDAGFAALKSRSIYEVVAARSGRSFAFMKQAEDLQTCGSAFYNQ